MPGSLKWECLGTRDVSRAADRRALLDRTREMLEILSITDIRRREPETIEWLFRCAGAAATREEACNELCSEPPRFVLSREQKDQLLDALVNGDSVDDWAARQLLRLAAPSSNDRRLLRRYREFIDSAALALPWFDAATICADAARYGDTAALQDNAERIIRLRDEMDQLVREIRRAWPR